MRQGGKGGGGEEWVVEPGNQRPMRGEERYEDAGVRTSVVNKRK